MPDHPQPHGDVVEPVHVPEYVIAAGAYRSGSTWLYNALRLALELGGHSVYGRFYDGTYDPEDPARVHVVKVHGFEPEVLEVSRVLCTSIRDPRDIAASAVRRGLIEPTVEAVEAFVDEAVLQGFERWRPHAALVLRYEHLHAGGGPEILQQVLDVLAPLGVAGVSVESLMQRLDALRPGAQYDRETLLWPNHITDGRVRGYRDTLSPAIVEGLEARFGEWMQANGYAA
ncbi:MAG: hypothetical protein AB1Z98_39050 [Nannocystaceae bacterium]